MGRGSRRQVVSFVALAGLLALTACGDGGGGDETVAAETAPPAVSDAASTCAGRLLAHESTISWSRYSPGNEYAESIGDTFRVIAGDCASVDDELAEAIGARLDGSETERLLRAYRLAAGAPPAGDESAATTTQPDGTPDELLCAAFEALDSEEVSQASATRERAAVDAAAAGTTGDIQQAFQDVAPSIAELDELIRRYDYDEATFQASVTSQDIAILDRVSLRIAEFAAESAAAHAAHETCGSDDPNFLLPCVEQQFTEYGVSIGPSGTLATIPERDVDELLDQIGDDSPQDATVLSRPAADGAIDVAVLDREGRTIALHTLGAKGSGHHLAETFTC